MKKSTKKLIEEVGTEATRIAAGAAASGAVLTVLWPVLKTMKLPAKLFYYLGSWGVGIGVSSLLEHSINKEIHETLELIPTTSENDEKDDVPDNVVVLDNKKAPQ